MTTETMVHYDATSELVGAPSSAAAGFPGLVDGVRDLFATASVAETLDTVVGLAHRGFGADGAGILWADDGGAASTAASGPEARRADVLQVDCHQGPGFHAMNGLQPVISPQLRFDGRWRFWSPQAADLGLCSVLSLALVDGESFAAVTLYSQRPSYFRTDSLAPGLWFAQQASLAITVALERRRLREAADSRGMVSQAQGILMERYHISADQAFAVIRRSSSALDEKLRVIAERIIGGRSLSDIDLIVRPHLTGATSMSGVRS